MADTVRRFVDIFDSHHPISERLNFLDRREVQLLTQTQKAIVRSRELLERTEQFERADKPINRS